MAVSAIDTTLGICKPFSGVCAWLVFTATALFALTTPSLDDSYRLNDLLTAIAEIDAREYKMSTKEEGEEGHHRLALQGSLAEAQKTSGLISLVAIYDHKSIINDAILQFITPFQCETS